MTRLRWNAAALLLALTAATTCRGQGAQPANATAAPRRPAGVASGGLVVNVLDFGAKADNGETDNSDAFQAAIDHVSAVKGPWVDHGGIVHVPGAPAIYGFKKPIFLDHSSITLRGDSAQTTMLTMIGTAHPLVLVGVRRTELYHDGKQAWNVKPDASNHPDLFGKLDSTAVPARGQRWGFRSRGSTYLQFQGTPLTLGVRDKEGPDASDDWSQTTAVTLEICCEPPLGQGFPRQAPIAGTGSIDSPAPAPFYLQGLDDTSESRLGFYYRSSTFTPDERDQFEGFHFSLKDATPPYRIAVSVDLASGQWMAFVNGRACPVQSFRDANQTSGTFKPIPGTTFQANRWEPFFVGALGLAGPVGKKSSGVDLRVYGLRVSRVARYVADAQGRQLRADTHRPPDDAWAYFGNDNDTVAFLPFDTPPSDSRLVPVANGGATYGGRSSGFLFHIYTPHWVSDVSISDLNLMGTGPYGYGVALGAVIEPHLERLQISKASYAIGSIVRRDNYRIHLSDLRLAGSESGYFGYAQIVMADRIMFSYSGRDTIRMFGCWSHWRDVMVTHWGSAATHTFQAIGGGTGGSHTIENLIVDFEGPTYRPGGAAIYCEAHQSCPATSLRLRDCVFGTIGNVPLIELKGAPPSNLHYAPAWFDAENVQSYEDKPLTLRVEGPLWHGSIRGFTARKGLRVENTRRFGPETNVKVQQ